MSDITPTHLIEVRDFSYRYPRTSVPALSDINLTISEGEFIGIVGPTGAGKTTLCLALAGLIPQVMGGKVKGQILLNGKDSATTPIEKVLFDEENKNALVGLTLQDPEAQLVGMTVEEDIAFGLENLGVPTPEIQARVNQVLKLIRMESFLDVFPYKLSGGQKQRIAIGSTLALRPKVLILDEPTSELDPIGRKEIFSVIKQLKEQSHLSIVVVEHHTEELALFCDRIWLMNEGKIIRNNRADLVFRETELLRSVGVRPPDGVELLYGLHMRGVIEPDSDSIYIRENEIIQYLTQQLNGRIR